MSTILRLTLIILVVIWLFSGGVTITPPTVSSQAPPEGGGSTVASTPADPVTPVLSAPELRYIGELGHTIQGPFLSYWSAGGAAVFGWPLTEAFADQCDGRPCTVQYFERARFEREAATAPVQLGHLGREYLAGQTFAPEAPFVSGPDRWYMPETGQALGFGFLRYWLANDGLRRLGLPISPEMSEGGLTVQYFERGRLDYLADRVPSERISVAPLGRPLIERRGWRLPAMVEVALSPPLVLQGRPLALAVRGATAAGGELAGAPLSLSRSGDVWRGFIGLAADAAIGTRQLTLLVTASDGSARRIERAVEIVPFDFPRERLTIPPGQSGLLDPGVRERELATVRPLYSILTPDPLWTGLWRWPVEGRISTEFATLRAYNNGPYTEQHAGLDIAAPTGTAVVAPAAGRVVYADGLPIRGNFVAIDHGLGVLTTYFHLAAIDVAIGQVVQPGDRIGRVGTTGLSTGPHLHWEARIAGVPVEPRTWLTNQLLP